MYYKKNLSIPEWRSYISRTRSINQWSHHTELWRLHSLLPTDWSAERCDYIMQNAALIPGISIDDVKDWVENAHEEVLRAYLDAVIISLERAESPPTRKNKKRHKKARKP